MTSPKQESPPSSPPIFRPWQLNLSSTTAAPEYHYNSCNKEAVNGHIVKKDKTADRRSLDQLINIKKSDNDSPPSRVSFKRSLEDRDKSANSKFLKVDNAGNNKVKRCANIHGSSKTTQASDSHSGDFNVSEKALASSYYPSRIPDPSVLCSIPMIPPGFPFHSPLPGFHVLPNTDRMPSLNGPLAGGCPTPRMMPGSSQFNCLPGPSILPGFESLAGPMVPLMDVLVPAAEVERVCAKRPRPKRFACSECGSAFSNKGQLKGHLRIHTGERPFACGHQGCGKKFTRNEELTRHRRIHSGARPFPCPLCDKRFGRKDHLKKHVRTHQRQTTMPPPQPLLLHHLHRLQQIHHCL